MVWLVFFAGLLFSSWGSAATVEVEGMALIDAGGLEEARRLAVQDALYKAEESMGVAVSSSTARTSSGALRESSRIHALGVAAHPEILDEWREGGTLYVRVRTEVKLRDEARSQTYRKKIAVTQFHVANPLQVQDIDNIWSSYPLTLLRLVEESGAFLPVQASSGALGQLALPLERAQNREIVRLLADQSGAQFVLSGIIHDAGVTPSPSRLPKVLHKTFSQDPGARRIESEVFLHDGISGALIARFRGQESAVGDETVGRDKPFGSGAFFATPFGGAVGRLLERQAQFIVERLGKLSFNARIIGIEGNKLFFDAGATSGLAPGDKFQLHTLSSVTDVLELSSNRLLGIVEKPVASLTVRQVQPLFSTGESDIKNQNIQIGDMIRFEPSVSAREK